MVRGIFVDDHLEFLNTSSIGRKKRKIETTLIPRNMKLLIKNAKKYEQHCVWEGLKERFHIL